MHPRLEECLGVVLADLRATGVPLPRVEDREWADQCDQPSAMLRAADGSGMGISTWLPDDEPDQLARVAGGVQDWVIEQRWRSGSNWPACPRHPSTHPLRPEVVAGRVWWRCPLDDTAVVEVGRLADA